MGAEKAGFGSRAKYARIAAMRMAMAQRCAPCLRQQGGRLASSLPSSRTDNGPSPKNRIRKMEKPRRIWTSR